MENNNMPDDGLKNGLDYNLPDVDAPKKASGGALPKGQIVVLIVMQIVTLLAVLFLLLRPSAAAVSGGTESADSERLLELAQRLERQGLTREAVDAWREYMDASGPVPEKRAKLWYRIGTIQQDGHLYEEALASYYRSDVIRKLPELEAEITRRSQECLEAMGKVAAGRRNLEERTSMSQNSKQELPLVEIGTWKLTKADVEAMAEQDMDRELTANGIKGEDAVAHKKEMMKSFAGENLFRYASQLVSEELLCRAAREEKLNESPEIRANILRIERSILANAYMRKAMEGVSASEADAKDFFTANPAAFAVPAAVRLAHIAFNSEKEAQDALKSLQDGADFAKLAAKLSSDKATADKGGELPGWLIPQEQQDWRRDAAKAALAADKLTKGQLLPDIIKGTGTWHVIRLLDRRPASQKDIKDKDVLAQAKQMVLERRSRERQEQLFMRLSSQYKVVWHREQTQPAGVQNQ